MNDLLLEVIATKAELSLDEFDQSFNYLFSGYFTPDKEMKYIKRSILLSMEELGYCEVDYKKRKLFCCSPAMVLLPGTGIKRTFWAGARTRDTISDLKRVQEETGRDLNIEITQQEHYGIPFPNLIVIESPSIKILKQVSDFLKIQFYENAPLSWVIANCSGDIDEYEAKLVFGSPITINWSCRIFNTERLAFGREESNLETVLKEYTNPVTSQKVHVWNKDGKSAYDIDREWGRYLALKYMKTDVLLYDQRLQILAVPSYVPLPRMLAKAVAMCSGRLSEKVMLKRSKPETTVSYDMYPGVTNKVAEIIAKKVGQRLCHYTFSF